MSSGTDNGSGAIENSAASSPSYDWTPVGVAGAGAAANVFSTWLNNRMALKREQEARSWNASQAALAWQRGLEQWQRENEYNTPSAQMERLREAGINPALAYASGVFNQASSATAAPMPEGAKAPPTQAWQVDPTLFSEVSNMAAQRDLIEAQAELARSEAELNIGKLPYYQQLIAESKKQIEVFNTEIEKKRAETALLNEDQKKRAAETAHIKFVEVMEGKRYMLERKQILAQVELYKKQGKYYDAEAAKALAEKALTEKELQLFVDTYGERVLQYKMGAKASVAEVAEMEAKLEQLGITVDWETGAITVNDNGYTGIRKSAIFNYASAAAEVIGSIFGVVMPVGRFGRAAKPLTQTRNYRAPGF